MQNKSMAHTLVLAGLAAVGVSTLSAGADAKSGFIVQETGSQSFDVSTVPPVAGGKGWQGQSTFNVTTGTTSLFVHYPCPSSAPTPVSGGINPNPAAYPSMSLIGNYNRGNGEWGWLTTWSSGAPAGSQIVYDVYCSKK